MFLSAAKVLQGYLIAIAVLTAAILASLVVYPFFSAGPILLFVAGLVVAAWYGRLWPALVYSFLATIATDELFGNTRFRLDESWYTLTIRFTFLCVIAILISSLRGAKDRLEMKARQQAAVAEFGRIALAGVRLPDLLDRAVAIATEVLGVKCSAVCRVLHESGEMEFVAATGWSKPVKGRRHDFREKDSLSGEVMKSKRPVMVPDLEKQDRLRGSASLDAEGIRSMVGTRIAPREGVYGILGAFETSPRHFSDDDVNFLQSIANIAAEAVDRFRSEEEVRSQRTWLRTTLTSIGDGVIATDADGKVILLNRVAERLTGWDEAAARGRDVDEVFQIKNAVSGSKTLDPVSKVFQTGSTVAPSDHALLISRDGRKIPIDDRAAPIRDGDEIKGVVLVFSDISERKRTESMALKRAEEIAAIYGFTARVQRADSVEEVYNAALDSITAAVKCDRSSILLFDESGEMEFVASRGLSEAYRRAAAGHSPWTQGEKGATPIGIGDVRETEIGEILRGAILREGISSLAFLPLISNEKLIGKMMIYFDRPHDFTEAEFEMAMTVANQIAPAVERKHSEARLRENEERLRLATQAGKVGVWDWDIRWNRIEWTDALYEMHGLRKGAFAGTVEAFSALVHPEDRSRVQAEIGKTLETGVPYDVEFRIVRSDGGVRWLFTNARLLSDENGPYRMIGATADITERVRADEDRRENEIMQRLVEAQESERQRIARDLHDHLGQKMTGLRFKIESALSKTVEDVNLQALLDEIQESALQIDRDIGFLSWELRPTELDDLGLDNALASFVREWSSQYAIKAEFHSNLADIKRQNGRLSRNVETNLYRIAQEGLNNIMKHANAKNVSVLLQYRKDRLVLIIEDDGDGLPDGYSVTSGRAKGSFGLIGMHERAALLKGSFELESRPGGGTTLITTVPLYRVFAGATAA